MRDETRMARRLAGMLHARLPETGFAKVADPRSADRRVRWGLPTLLRGAIAGIVSGAQSCGETEELTSVLSPASRRLLGVSRRLPDTTLRAVLTKVEPEELRKCLRRQTKAAQRRKALEPEGLPFGVVAVDGKHTAISAWDEAYSQKQSEGAGGEADRPWIVASPQGTVVVMLLRRIAYNLLALFRAVTQRSEEKRGTPWKSLLRKMRDTLVALRNEDLAGLRDRKALTAFVD